MRPEELRVDIRWRAVRNRNAVAGDWLPQFSVNGRNCGHEWARQGCDLDTALRIAKQGADAEAERYIGDDWNVTVRQDEPSGDSGELNGQAALDGSSAGKVRP